MYFQCEGCNERFGREGDLIQHLNKTQNPLCITARNKIQAEMRPPVKGGKRVRQQRSSQSKSNLQQPTTSDGASEEVGSFAGDFFGNDYTDADFPFPDQEAQPEHPANVDESGEDSDQSDIDEFLPPQIHAPISTHDHLSDINEPRMEVDEPEAEAAVATAPGGLSIEDHNTLRSPPSHVSHFGGQAGKPISDSSLRSSGYNGYKEYVGATRNEWAPFVSRLDWEIASWAKLRGPGSTAFSELLSIDGVFHLQILHFNFLC